MAGKEERLENIEKLTAKADFWENQETATAVLKERRLVSGKVDNYRQLEAALEDSEVLLELAVEEEEEEVLKEATVQIADIAKHIDQLSFDLMLDDPEDQNNAIVSINAGAGGTEAQDWAEMLFRMYMRWVERKRFSAKAVGLATGRRGRHKKRHLYRLRRLRLWLSEGRTGSPSAGENLTL